MRFVESRGGNLLPPTEALERFISICYQASLLSEELRTVAFRAMWIAPALIPRTGRPPESLQKFEFTQPTPFGPGELRRLSAATDSERVIIGVGPDSHGGLQIWGLIHSGTRWLREIYGGRKPGAPLPQSPILHVQAPGSLSLFMGHRLVGSLQGGRVSGSRIDPFESKWLPEEFSSLLDEFKSRYEAERMRSFAETGELWAPLSPDLPRKITERLLKRIISVLRSDHHGGTLIFVPDEVAEGCLIGQCPVELKHRFADARAREAFPDLIVAILNRLAQIHVSTRRHDQEEVGWQEFESTSDDEIQELDEALFETAYLIASLASADGAVLMSKRNEVIGFGGMISGRLPVVRTVGRALDLEGEKVLEEEVTGVGARHQSAYTLVAAVPGAVAIVISQDGNVRFVSSRHGRVVYWEQEQ